MARIQDIEELQEQLRTNKNLRLDFYSCINRLFKNYDLEVDTDLILRTWLAENPLAPDHRRSDRWGEP